MNFSFGKKSKSIERGLSMMVADPLLMWITSKDGEDQSDGQSDRSGRGSPASLDHRPKSAPESCGPSGDEENFSQSSTGGDPGSAQSPGKLQKKTRRKQPLQKSHTIERDVLSRPVGERQSDVPVINVESSDAPSCSSHFRLTKANSNSSLERSRSPSPKANTKTGTASPGLDSGSPRGKRGLFRTRKSDTRRREDEANKQHRFSVGETAMIPFDVGDENYLLIHDASPRGSDGEEKSSVKLTPEPKRSDASSSPVRLEVPESEDSCSELHPQWDRRGSNSSFASSVSSSFIEYNDASDSGLQKKSTSSSRDTVFLSPDWTTAQKSRPVLGRSSSPQFEVGHQKPYNIKEKRGSLDMEYHRPHSYRLDVSGDLARHELEKKDRQMKNAASLRVQNFLSGIRRAISPQPDARARKTISLEGSNYYHSPDIEEQHQKAKFRQSLDSKPPVDKYKTRKNRHSLEVVYPKEELSYQPRKSRQSLELTNNSSAQPLDTKGNDIHILQNGNKTDKWCLSSQSSTLPSSKRRRVWEENTRHRARHSHHGALYDVSEITGSPNTLRRNSLHLEIGPCGAVSNIITNIQGKFYHHEFMAWKRFLQY